MGTRREISHVHKELWEIEVTLGTFPSKWDTGMLKAGFNSSDSENRTTLNVLLVVRKREKKRNKDNQPTKLLACPKCTTK